MPRYGPSVLAPPPGLPWSLAERRRKEKHLAEGIELRTNRATLLAWMGSKISQQRPSNQPFHISINNTVQSRYYCTFLACNYAWSLVEATHLHRSPFESHGRRHARQKITGLPLIGLWCGRKKMESGWQGFHRGLARRCWMALNWMLVYFGCMISSAKKAQNLITGQAKTSYGCATGRVHPLSYSTRSATASLFP